MLRPYSGLGRAAVIHAGISEANAGLVESAPWGVQAKVRLELADRAVNEDPGKISSSEAMASIGNRIFVVRVFSGAVIGQEMQVDYVPLVSGKIEVPRCPRRCLLRRTRTDAACIVMALRMLKVASRTGSSL